jgi:hypothetical protein
MSGAPDEALRGTRGSRATSLLLTDLVGGLDQIVLQPLERANLGANVVED